MLASLIPMKKVGLTIGEAQTSSVTDYISAGHLSINPDDVGAHLSSDSGNAWDLATACPNGTGELASTYIEAGNPYTTNKVSTQQEGATAISYDASQDLATLGDTPIGSFQVTDYESSTNGNNTAEARDIAAVGIAVNGIASDVHGSSNMHQPKDGLGSNLNGGQYNST
ncbi:hypothetical protein FXO37_12646 [Capsicum annuum]|nr:hypothetical protein FXO37_12646 [Capsicum annuum]